MSSANVTSPATQAARIKKSPDGLFKSLRRVGIAGSQGILDGIDSLLFEQKKSTLRSRLIEDSEFLSQLKDDAAQYGGIEACVANHNELIELIEEIL